MAGDQTDTTGIYGVLNKDHHSITQDILVWTRWPPSDLQRGHEMSSSQADQHGNFVQQGKVTKLTCVRTTHKIMILYGIPTLFPSQSFSGHTECIDNEWFHRCLRAFWVVTEIKQSSCCCAVKGMHTSYSVYHNVHKNEKLAACEEPRS